MPRYAPTMSQADLRQLLIEKAIANDYVEEYDEIDPNDPKLWSIVGMLLGEDLIPEVAKDWSKIDFSTENLDVTAERTTPDGVPYLQIRTGGDWETPLVAILYFDGRKLRGYVPKDGNTYNRRAKAAFGNSDDDAEQAAKQFGRPFTSDTIDVKPDYALIDADVAGRIEAKGTHSHSSSSVASKASAKAARQAEIEKDQDLSGDITKDMVYAVIEPAAGGSYVEFELRSSRRSLRPDECHRLVGVPAQFEKKDVSGSILWYAPMGMYPQATQEVLEAAGFAKAPDNDISGYAGARTIFI